LSLVIIILGYIVGGTALLLIHGAFGFSQYEWGTPLSQTLGHVAAGAVLGLAMGLFQRSFLKKLFNVPAFWIYALIIGFVVIELISGIILSQMGINRGEIKFFEYQTPGDPPGESFIYAIVGLLTSLIQWPILSRSFSRSAFWVLASTLGWGICFMITMISVWAFFLGALLYGAITGATLMWIMRTKEV
jgi:divalent metal cation (Fe/Co/Zn/Cd) transporter